MNIIKSIKTLFTPGNDNNLRTFFGVVSLIIVGLGVLGTFFFASSNNERHNREINSNSEQISTDILRYISARSSSSTQLLYSASSVFSIGDIDANDWKNFADNSRLQTVYPGVLALGYTQYLKPSEVDSFVADMKSSGYPNYTIQPDYPRDEYTAIKYIAPLTDSNKFVLGYDMMTDPLRSHAMQEARDTGEVSFSNGVIAKQDINKTNPPLSVLAYYPIYRTGSTPPTLEEKRAQLEGFVYIVIRINDLFSQEIGVLEKNNAKYSLSEIIDGKEKNLFDYSSKGYKAYKTSKTLATTLKFREHTWISRVTINADSDALTYTTIFTLGLFSSVLIGMVTFWILIKRFKLIRISHEEEIQKTKDELLALASHQLRTPATAVRQYIGMIKNGYFGDLSNDQSEIINKAFSANDRQLEIIDQLLYVAKADAGQLAVSIKKFDLVPVLNNTFESMKEIASKKSLNFNLKVPNKLEINADERYVSMILDNLINNSIKYCYKNGTINIELKKKDNNAILNIKDNGVGIEKKDIEKLFQKFSRIDNPLSDIESGTGLGLFLADKLASAHGGKITVKSSTSPRKHGSTFTLSLPIKPTKVKSVIQLTEIGK